MAETVASFSPARYEAELQVRDVSALRTGGMSQPGANQPHQCVHTSALGALQQKVLYDLKVFEIRCVHTLVSSAGPYGNGQDCTELSIIRTIIIKWGRDVED